jgi:hypothetical protein
MRLGEPVRVKGRYDGKQVRLLEPAPTDKECDVTVVFETGEDREEGWRVFFATFGRWEDERSFEEMVRDIYTARTPGRERISL